MAEGRLFGGCEGAFVAGSALSPPAYLGKYGEIRFLMLSMPMAKPSP